MDQNAAASEQDNNVVDETSGISILEYDKSSFSPIRKELFSIPIRISHPEKIRKLDLEIRTADNDLINTLKIAEIEKGKTSYTLSWSGRDMEGDLVPDEAYIPVIVVTDIDSHITYIDPRNNSGGEEIYEFDKRIYPGTIEYKLPVASRMLIRSGIKNGPMLRTIIDWQPRSAGFHAERWSGLDSDKIIKIEENPEVGYLIIGYQLPTHSIITYGNTQESYREYRERQQWSLPEALFTNQPRERGGKLIRPEIYTPILKQKSPAIEVNLFDTVRKKTVTAVEGMEELFVEIKLDPLDELYLDQERYEICFFVDNEFIAEEEQGFVPFKWRWSPGRFGITPGTHVLTINVSGYSGQVGVRNLAFTLNGE